MQKFFFIMNKYSPLSGAIKFSKINKKQIQKRDNKVVALGNPSKQSGCSNHVLKQIGREYLLKISI